MTRLDQLKAIKAHLPDATRADKLQITEADALLYHCALCIDGAATGWNANWPDGDSMDRLAAFQQGFGCWLDEIAAAIEAAPIDADRALWRVAFNGAAAVVHAYHVRRYVSIFA